MGILANFKITAAWLLLGGVAMWVTKLFVQEGIKRLGQDFWPFALRRRRQTMGRRDLRRYRTHVIRNYNTNALGFLHGVSVRVTDVYVPLQFLRDGRREDVYENIRQEMHTVVLGAAGAGKSMLLKNSMVRWAEEPLIYQRTPVLVELFRCNNGGASLFELVGQALVRNGVRKPERFLANVLNAGLFSVLFDGLDEVVTDQRADVVGQIERFAEEFPACQIMVTSRDAVYNGDLRPIFSHEVRIADFDDAGTRRFLRLWLGRDAHDDQVREQVEQMMLSLRASASLHRIAQSPLMLTIIASLHDADPGIGASLSNSRAEFYETAVQHLLRRDHDLGRQGPIASYKAGHKYMALRKIALAAQGAMARGADRRAIPEPELIVQIIDAMSRFNLDSGHARPMMDEIVERSGLLVQIDEANLLYEFPHLTLQEYLAAMELADDPDRLLDLYRRNPGRWRETVKLWCGGANRDCTELVRAIFGGTAEADKILALECVAEAKQLGDGLAALVLAHFEARLGSGGPHAHLVVSALGACAADPGPRGRALLQRLRAIAYSPSQPQRDDAIDALAAARIRPALEILADVSLDVWHARRALRSMGDLAVPVLAERAEQGEVVAVDDLAAVATVSAAGAISRLLWHPDRPTAIRAAWRMAELLGDNPDIEEELSAETLTEIQGRDYWWLWEPFAPGNHTIRAITGRAAFLIDHSHVDEMPGDLRSIDPRIAIPLAVVGIETSILQDDRHVRIAKRIDSLARKHNLEDPVKGIWPQSAPKAGGYLRIMAQRNIEEALPIAQEILGLCTIRPIRRQLLHTLPGPIVTWIASFVLIQSFVTSADDWRRVGQTPKDPKWLRLLSTVVSTALVGAGTALGVAGLLRAAFGAPPQGPSWVTALAGVGLALLLAGGILQKFFDTWHDDPISLLVVVAGAVLLVAIIVGYAAVGVIDTLGWNRGVALLVAASAWTAGSIWLIRRHSRIMNNPFRLLLALDQRIMNTRATVIALIPTAAPVSHRAGGPSYQPEPFGVRSHRHRTPTARR